MDPIQLNIVFYILSSYFLKNTSIEGYSKYELRKQLIRFRSICKNTREYTFYKVVNIKFNFSDYRKIQTFVQERYTDHWYSTLKLMRSFVIQSRYQDLSFDVDKWTKTQWRLHHTISLYGIVKHNKWCWVGQCPWIRNEPFKNAFNDIKEYTPENIDSAMKLMSLNDLMSLGV